MAVAEYFSGRHFEAMDRLGVIRPDISPRATGHIPEQLEAIENSWSKALPMNPMDQYILKSTRTQNMVNSPTE